MILYKITFKNAPFQTMPYKIVYRCNCSNNYGKRTFIAKKDMEDNNYFRFWDKTNNQQLYYAHPDWLENIVELP